MGWRCLIFFKGIINSLSALVVIVVGVDRGLDGTRVIFWYHRQFLETAQARYLADEEYVRRSHEFIADYFMGKWAGQSNAVEF